MKSTSVVIGLLVGCIIAAATGYFDRTGIESAPAVSFIWVKTFPLSIYGPLVLPMMAVGNKQSRGAESTVRVPIAGELDVAKSIHRGFGSLFEDAVSPEGLTDQWMAHSREHRVSGLCTRCK